jgi:hypothetical protein
LHLRADEQHRVNRHEVVDVEGLSFLLREARGDDVVQRDLTRAAWVLKWRAWLGAAVPVCSAWERAAWVLILMGFVSLGSGRERPWKLTRKRK